MQSTVKKGLETIKRKRITKLIAETKTELKATNYVEKQAIPWWCSG